MAIYYRKEKFDLLDHGTFWLSESPDIVSRGWDAACNRTVTWVKLKLKGNNKSFYYFNTHLDHQGKIARSKSIELITEKILQIAGKKPVVILGGDMNSSLDSPIFKPILRYMKPAREKAKQTPWKDEVQTIQDSDWWLWSPLHFRPLPDWNHIYILMKGPTNKLTWTPKVRQKTFGVHVTVILTF